MNINDLCAYCGEARIDTQMGYQWSCNDCTFTCPDCKYIKPMELGSGECQSCDDCCIGLHDTEDKHVKYA